jgi:predicted RNA binding protein YcfA (HicA-like mRNA interferase family)
MKGKNGNETFTVIVPNYNEIPIGTLKSIIRQAGLSPEDFIKLF